MDGRRGFLKQLVSAGSALIAGIDGDTDRKIILPEDLVQPEIAVAAGPMISLADCLVIPLRNLKSSRVNLGELYDVGIDPRQRYIQPFATLTIEAHFSVDSPYLQAEWGKITSAESNSHWSLAFGKI